MIVGRGRKYAAESGELSDIQIGLVDQRLVIVQKLMANQKEMQEGLIVESHLCHDLNVSMTKQCIKDAEELDEKDSKY